MLTDRDRVQIRASGRDPSEVERWLAVLGRPKVFVDVRRPATVGDGILRLPPADRPRLEAMAMAAAAAGRLSSFIPASGAATRLAASLDEEALARFGFLARFHDADELAALPKALVPVHDYGDHVRTPLEEHFHEAAALTRSDAGAVRLHFTVGGDAREAFSRAVAGLTDRLAHLGRFEVALSEQHPATDTPFVTADGLPVRDGDGALAFRPGGHGALLRNLAELGADLVLVKNIDNVVVASRRPAVLAARRQLIGQLVALQEGLRAARSEGEAAVRAWFRDHTGEAVRDVEAAVGRPMRVCGMVPNDGAPGGGPFFTDRGLQIVEGVEIDTRRADQRAAVEGATHFNPVELALATRDLDGRPLDLRRFVDEDRVLVADKVVDGRPCRVVERPGLWNGAMSEWITCFVEMPAEVFAPIKTVADLATPGHLAP